jgi:hypothetical protein
MPPLSLPTWQRAYVLAVVVAIVFVAALCTGQPPLSRASTLPHRYKPGITLTGPLTNVSLDTKYTYAVQVVAAKSYRHATILFFVPESACLFRQVVNLMAYRPWRGNFTLEYRSTNEMETRGIGVSVATPPSKYGARILFGKAYRVTPAPNQVPHPSPSGAPCPQPLFGS